MLRLAEAFFVMVSAMSAAVAVRDARGAREAERRDRWRREQEGRLDALADAIVGVGAVAIGADGDDRALPELQLAQLRLRRALLDALNPWIEIEAIDVLANGPATAVDATVVEHALGEIANNVEAIRDQAGKAWRQRKRELRRALR
jgi:hypothetical protein